MAGEGPIVGKIEDETAYVRQGGLAILIQILRLKSSVNRKSCGLNIM